MKKLVFILLILCASTAHAGLLGYWGGENPEDVIELYPDNMPETVFHWTFPARLRYHAPIMKSTYDVSGDADDAPFVWGVPSGTNGISAYSGSHMIQLHKLTKAQAQAINPSYPDRGYDRAELYLDARQLAQNVANLEHNKNYWIGFAFYIPSATFPHWNARAVAFTQGHVVSCVGAGVSGQDYDSWLTWDSGYTTLTLTSIIRYNDAYCEAQNHYASGAPWSAGAVTLDTWHTMVLHIKPNWGSQAVQGRFEAWFDGNKYADYTGNVGRMADKGMAPLMPSLYPGSDVNDTQEAIIYYDEFAVGDFDSNYNEVAPGGDINQPPQVTISPSTTQTIAQNDSVVFSMNCSDSDGYCNSYLWTFDDSGISNDTSEDPGSKQFTQVGTFLVRGCASDDDAATSCGEVTVIVGVGGLTGLISEHLFDTGTPGADHESNQPYTITEAVLEGSGTCPYTPDSGDNKALVFDGTNDKAVPSGSLHASMPWQTGQAVGTFIAYHNPDVVNATQYLGGRYDATNDKRTWSLLTLSTGNLATNIGVNSGTEFEQYQMNQTITAGNWNCSALRLDTTAGIWALSNYDKTTDTWFTPTSGGISGTVNLGGDATLTLAARSDNSGYYDGKIGWDQYYNTWLTDGEIVEACEGAYEEPPAPTNVIDSMCFVSDKTAKTCITADHTFHTGQDICLKMTFGLDQSYTYDGSYANFEWPFTLDSGALSLLYYSGSGSNEWIFCDKVGSTDKEVGDVVLSTTGDFIRNRTGPTSTIKNESGTELSDYYAPATDFDSNKVTVIGPAHVHFAPE